MLVACVEGYKEMVAALVTAGANMERADKASSRFDVAVSLNTD